MLSAITRSTPFAPQRFPAAPRARPAAEDPGLHRTLGHAGQLGDLRVGAAEHVVEDDRDAIGLVERVQSARWSSPESSLSAKRSRGSAGSGGSSAGRMRRFCAHVVGGVDADPVEPGREERAAAELRQGRARRGGARPAPRRRPPRATRARAPRACRGGARGARRAARTRSGRLAAPGGRGRRRRSMPDEDSHPARLPGRQTFARRSATFGPVGDAQRLTPDEQIRARARGVRGRAGTSRSPSRRSSRSSIPRRWGS